MAVDTYVFLKTKISRRENKRFITLLSEGPAAERDGSQMKSNIVLAF
jgi:hypothetical protein